MVSNCYNQRLSLLTVSLLLLSILSSTQLRFMAQGRAIPQLKKTSPQENMKALSEEDNKTMVRTRIGSRPPRCERRCRSCGHCEAIQVPTNPQLKFGHSKNNTSHISNVEYARDDSTSNYKPMSWKCKCGEFIFNP